MRLKSVGKDIKKVIEKLSWQFCNNYLDNNKYNILTKKQSQKNTKFSENPIL